MKRVKILGFINDYEVIIERNNYIFDICDFNYLENTINRLDNNDFSSDIIYLGQDDKIKIVYNNNINKIKVYFKKSETIEISEDYMEFLIKTMCLICKHNYSI